MGGKKTSIEEGWDWEQTEHDKDVLPGYASSIGRNYVHSNTLDSDIDTSPADEQESRDGDGGVVDVYEESRELMWSSLSSHPNDWPKWGDRQRYPSRSQHQSTQLPQHQQHSHMAHVPVGSTSDFSNNKLSSVSAPVSRRSATGASFASAEGVATTTARTATPDPCSVAAEDRGEEDTLGEQVNTTGDRRHGGSEQDVAWEFFHWSGVEGNTSERKERVAQINDDSAVEAALYGQKNDSPVDGRVRPRNTREYPVERQSQRGTADGFMGRDRKVTSMTIGHASKQEDEATPVVPVPMCLGSNRAFVSKVLGRPWGNLALEALQLTAIPRSSDSAAEEDGDVNAIFADEAQTMALWGCALGKRKKSLDNTKLEWRDIVIALNYQGHLWRLYRAYRLLNPDEDYPMPLAHFHGPTFHAIAQDCRRKMMQRGPRIIEEKSQQTGSSIEVSEGAPVVPLLRNKLRGEEYTVIGAGSTRYMQTGRARDRDGAQVTKAHQYPQQRLDGVLELSTKTVAVGSINTKLLDVLESLAESESGSVGDVVPDVTTNSTARQFEEQGSSIVDKGKSIGAVNVPAPMAAVPPKDGIPAPLQDRREQHVRRVSSAPKETRKSKSRTAHTVPGGVTSDRVVGERSRISGGNSQVSEVVVKGDPKAFPKTRRRRRSDVAGGNAG